MSCDLISRFLASVPAAHRHAGLDDVLPMLIVNPYRPHRIEPRSKKRRPKQYDLMNKPRNLLRRLLKNKRKRA